MSPHGRRHRAFCLARLTAIYLLLGAFATVAVAWVVWVCVDVDALPVTLHHPALPGSGPVEMHAPMVGQRKHRAAAYWTVIRIANDNSEVEEIEQIVPRWTRLWPSDWGEVSGLDEGRSVAAYGWPRLALASRSIAPEALPLYPIWRGLAAGTVVFSLVILAVHQVAGNANRLRRPRLGRCSYCGYDLTGITGPCPECGTERRT